MATPSIPSTTRCHASDPLWGQVLPNRAHPVSFVLPNAGVTDVYRIQHPSTATSLVKVTSEGFTEAGTFTFTRVHPVLAPDVPLEEGHIVTVAVAMEGDDVATRSLHWRHFQATEVAAFALSWDLLSGGDGGSQFVFSSVAACGGVLLYLTPYATTLTNVTAPSSSLASLFSDSQGLDTSDLNPSEIFGAIVWPSAALSTPARRAYAYGQPIGTWIWCPDGPAVMYGDD